MRRSLLLILGCLFIVAFSVAAADFPLTVSGIAIDGNVKIKTNDIVKVITFHVGDEITADQMKAASQAVYDLGWFSDVIPEVDDTGTVTFKLTENPVVKKIEITGNVNTEPFSILGFTLFSTRIMTSDKARSILRDKGVKTGKVLNNDSLKDGLQAVIDAYHKKGYALIMIGKVTPGETLGIQIIEGRVTANAITGLSTVPEKIADDMIDLPVNECLKKAAIQQVMANLQGSVYFSNVDVKVQQGGTPDSVRLLWTLNERELIDAPIMISGIDLSGVTLFPQQIAERALADISQGEIDNYGLLQALQGLFDLYYRNEYVMARFTPGQVINGRLPLTVEEGEIGTIEINGNDHTKTYVIEKVLGIKSGDMLNKNRLAVSYQSLMALGYFNSVNVNPAWLDDSVELSVSVVENAKLGGINGSVAFSPESGGLVGKLDYHQKNLFGTGQDLSFSYSRGLVNDQSATWDVGYSTVAFFRAFNRVGLDFYRETDTDDLDLSFRLLLAGHPVGMLWNPPVEEEAVLTLPSLWRQRQRWAEGGLQRFFDYWPGLTSSRLSLRKRLDLGVFFFIQYALPVIGAFDLFTALLTRSQPAIWPLTFVASGLTGGAMVIGCRRSAEGPALPPMNPFSIALGMGYLAHWFVVIPWVALRMALLPKRLVWAKTLHLGVFHDDPDDDDALPGDPDLTTQVS